jgi:hypothetical protein
MRCVAAPCAAAWTWPIGAMSIRSPSISNPVVHAENPGFSHAMIVVHIQLMPGRQGIHGALPGERRKMFFFEKKNQKTFAFLGVWWGDCVGSWVRASCR